MRISEYLAKMRGMPQGSPPRVGSAEILWSWIGGFLGIAAIAWVNLLVFEGLDLTLMIGSFGASAVLVFGAVRSPLAQPRNVIGGPLMPCSVAPLTGFFRDGCCHTGAGDVGLHVVCAEMTEEFLAFSRSVGNDLSTPMPEYGFAGQAILRQQRLDVPVEPEGLAPTLSSAPWR